MHIWQNSLILKLKLSITEAQNEMSTVKAKKHLPLLKLLINMVTSFNRAQEKDSLFVLDELTSTNAFIIKPDSVERKNSLYTLRNSLHL